VRVREVKWAPPLAIFLGLAGVGYWVMCSSYSQLLGRFPYRGTDSGNAGKRIALTFDDGPNEPFTTEIADFLAEHGIRATFFQVGACVERFPEVSRRLLADGHVIGNHSATHTLARCWGRRAQRAETDAAQAALTRVLRREPALYRPPWLLRTPSLFGILRQRGLVPISGTFCHAFEVFQPAPARIARRALAKCRSGAIIIFHDGFDARGGNRASTVEAVRLVVLESIRRGFEFVTVDELLVIPAYQ